jgi:L-alanine-DL-glutamate epimerase-like enolase superfamily enzyme
MWRLSVPLQRHYVSGIHDYRATENVLLELDAGDLVGRAHAFAFVPAHADAIRALMIDLAESLVGWDVTTNRDVYARLLRRINFIGAGVATIALGAIDTALWDLVAQHAGSPLHRMLGSTRSSLPVYASGGWFTYSKEELVDEALAFAEGGFVGYKIKVGHEDWQIDLERVEHVLGVIGDRIELMVDANQAWTVQQSIEAGQAFAELGVRWLEEPVPVHDVEGSAQVAAAVDLSLANGETVFTRHGFQPLIERRAADVLMINLLRCGGPSEFLHVAGEAAAHGLPVSSHTLTEVSAHVMAACANATTVEYIPGWWDVLFEDAPGISGGKIILADRPGLGFRFSEQAIRDYSVDGGAAERAA